MLALLFVFYLHTIAMFLSFIFLGLDGCFVKLNIGQQILAATGRDGNNNIFPLAFGVVEKEDTPTWCWFLTQLKIVLGGESGQFENYTIILDRQKVCNVDICFFSFLSSVLHNIDVVYCTT